MKIKKKGKKKGQKKKAPQKSGSAGLTDRTNFFIVIGIILLVNLLIYFTAFPTFDDMAAIGSNPDAESRATFIKLTVIVVTDAFLFVTLSMVLSRRSAKRK